MAPFEMTPDRPFSTSLPAEERVTAFLRSVYGWMCGGLAITALTASVIAASPAFVFAVATNRVLFWGLMIAQLGIVFVLSARVQQLAASTAALLFVAYSALTGVTISFVLLAYTGESVATTFLVTAGMFGAMAAYGTTTQRSLAGFGQFLFMGLIGVVLASIVGMFWHSDGLQFVISFIGVIVFTGLAAYDAQRLKSMALSMPTGQTGSYAIVGALALYLDFINLFLFLIPRLTGNRRDLVPAVRLLDLPPPHLHVAAERQSEAVRERAELRRFGHGYDVARVEVTRDVEELQAEVRLVFAEVERLVDRDVNREVIGESLAVRLADIVPVDVLDRVGKSRAPIDGRRDDDGSRQPEGSPASQPMGHIGRRWRLRPRAPATARRGSRRACRNRSHRPATRPARN